MIDRQMAVALIGYSDEGYLMDPASNIPEDNDHANGAEDISKLTL